MCHHAQPLTCFELWVPNTSFGGGLQTLGFMERVTERERKIPKPYYCIAGYCLCLLSLTSFKMDLGDVSNFN